ncbi:MAG: hypothetical protein D6731_25515 [Planctomycetota bacterium]|nr:MAG: hypothetical protein D6731_25515 [Planctomycetota bacterium]
MSPAERAAEAEKRGDRLLAQAWDLAYEREDYEGAVRLLEGFPRELRGEAIFKKIEEKLRLYHSFAGFRKRLQKALEEGKDSPALAQMIKHVEREDFDPDLDELPCVARFRKKARELVGDERYDALELEVSGLDEVEDMQSEGIGR